MKTRVIAFYAMSILFLSLFVILPAANSSSIDNVIPKTGISQILIESADHLLNAGY